ncbi:hypothetical protein PIB30_028727 [Stylosanthes scabra]|uniref:RNase H type-1 domain-containing protein n=1 Tax=Stylosanthes scabra TaxID=79078 RepID=A0ABU6V954_9FABA|nr:hypothetical protein [Stylosanthes scabra]
METAELAIKKHDEFLKAQLLEANSFQTKPPGAASSNKWETPTTHLVKVDVDASCIDDGAIGIRMVARDSSGAILMAATWKDPYPFQPHEAQAKACLVGLQRAQQCCFLDIMLESDNLERSGNRVTHELAHMALINLDSVWMEDAPNNICILASADLNDPIHE